MFSAYHEYGNNPMACAQSLVSIEPEHIIIDELHLVLHICDKLLRNLILDTKTLDDKNTVHGEKSDFLGQLTEKIRGCSVSFYIWTKKGTQGELDLKNKKVIYPPFTFFKNIFNVRELMYDVFLTSRNDINSKMKWDTTVDALQVRKRIEHLTSENCERDKRNYTKSTNEYWNDIIFRLRVAKKAILCFRH
jgi:hypothetical protein